MSKPIILTCVRNDKHKMLSKRKSAMLRRARSCGDIFQAARTTTSTPSVSLDRKIKPLGRWESQAADSDTNPCTTCIRKVRRSQTHDGCIVVHDVVKNKNKSHNDDHSRRRRRRQIRSRCGSNNNQSSSTTTAPQTSLDTTTTTTTTTPCPRRLTSFSRWDSGSDNCHCDTYRPGSKSKRKNSSSSSPPRVPRTFWGLAA